MFSSYKIGEVVILDSEVADGMVKANKGVYIGMNLAACIDQTGVVCQRNIKKCFPPPSIDLTYNDHNKSQPNDIIKRANGLRGKRWYTSNEDFIEYCLNGNSYKFPGNATVALSVKRIGWATTIVGGVCGWYLGGPIGVVVGTLMASKL